MAALAPAGTSTTAVSSATIAGASAGAGSGAASAGLGTLARFATVLRRQMRYRNRVPKTVAMIAAVVSTRISAARPAAATPRAPMANVSQLACCPVTSETLPPPNGTGDGDAPALPPPTTGPVSAGPAVAPPAPGSTVPVSPGTPEPMGSPDAPGAGEPAAPPQTVTVAPAVVILIAVP